MVESAGSPACGDLIKLYLKIKKVNGEDVIEKSTFESYGCAEHTKALSPAWGNGLGVWSGADSLDEGYGPNPCQLRKGFVEMSIVYVVLTTSLLAASLYTLSKNS